MPNDVNPYDALLQGEEDRVKTQQAATLTTAIDTNPDQYATQKRVAGYLGYPVAAVEATPEASARQAQTQQIQDDTAPHPVLQQKYTDADFAKLAHDDSGTLSKLADAVSATAKYVFSAPDSKNTLAGDVVGGYHAAGRGTAGVGRAVSEVAANAAELLIPGLESMESSGTAGGNPLRRLAEGFDILGRDSGARQKAASPADDGLFQSGVSSGVQSFVGNTLQLPMALFGPAGELAALFGMSAQQGGSSYQEAREKGVNVATALPYALSQAAIEYATEKLPLHALIGDVKTGASMFKTLAHQIATEVPGEQIATILQDMNEWAVLPENKDKPFSAYLADRPSAAAQTLIATVIGIGGNVAVMKSAQTAIDNANGQQREIASAEQDAEKFKQLFTLAAQSKLRERAPDHLADFIQQQAEHTEGAPTEAYIDARTLAGEGGLLNQEKVAELLPSVAPQLLDALATGGDVSIPIGELTTAVAGTPLEEKITEHLKFTPEALSQFEAKQAQDQAAEFLQSEAGRITSEGVEASDTQRSAEAVKGQVLSQLNTANRFTPEVNDAYASLVRDFYTVTGQRLGVTPEEMFAAHPLRVSAAGVGGLDQTAYHGTPHEVDKFTTQKIGTGEGHQVYGWGMYFAGNKEIADFYSKNVKDMTKVETINKRLSALSKEMDAHRGAEYGKFKTPEGYALKEEYDRLMAEKLADTGRTYKVEVPEDHDLLDYDVNVGNQSPKVQAALAKLGIQPTKVRVISASGTPLGTFATLEEARAEIKSKNLDAKPLTRPNPLSGRAIYEDLVAKLGSAEAASRALNEAGIPGLRYLDAGSRRDDVQTKNHNYVIFDDSHVGAPEVLNQGETAPRGTFNPKTLSISLLEGADLSTFLHETGHFFLEVMADVSSQPNAPEALANDIGAVMKWFGVKDLATWNAMTLEEQRPYHEQFAESFEQYIFEGKAPNQELQPLFARFRSWMTNVYKSLSDFMASHNTKLSKEVRGVFDRLLATDDSISEAETARAYAPLFKSAAQAGMTPQEWAAYQAIGERATDKAIETLEARSLRDMRWTTGARSRALKALQKDTEAKRKAVETEVKEELAAQPIEQARAYVKELQKGEAANTKEHKEAMRAWRDEYATAKGSVTEEVKADENFKNKAERKLEVDRRMLQWEAEHEAPQPKISEGEMDTAAELFGYSSGDELATVMRNTPPMAELVEGMTDQRLLERFGDLTTVQGMNRAADEAVHNEARAKFIATGLKSLQDGGKQNEKEPGKKNSVNVLMKAARQFAEQLVARRKVRDLKPGQHLSAETRAGKAALAAVAKGDTKLAIASQRDQLLNHFAARMTQSAIGEVDKGVKYLRAFATNTSLPQEYRDQINRLLERFDLVKVPLKAVDKRASLVEWVESQRAIGIEPELPPELLNDAMRQNYRDMTVEEFRGLVDAVKQIDHLGRLKDKLLTAKDQRDFEATRDAIAQSIIDNRGKHKNANTRTPTTNAARWWKAIKDFGAAHIKAATYARVLDGGKDGGPMWEYFVRSANAAGDKETTMRAQATKALSEILAPYFDSGKLGGKGKFFPSVGKSFNRESILTIALNTGNDGNLQRLLGGEGWTVEQLQPILATLGAKDWAVVQNIWDHFESYKKAIGEKSTRIYGTQPDWVEPTPRTMTLADGSTVNLKGGYYPIKYDPAASVRAEEHADAEGAKRMLQGAYGAATTRRSFTKTRAEEVTGRPLLYTLAGVYSGVNDVIHDLNWHEWLIDVNRLLKSKSIDSAIRDNYGPEVVRQFKSWRDAVAEGDVGSQEALDTALGKLRQGVSIAGLGFNVMSALMQPLGMAQSIVRIGPQASARGIMQYIANPVKATREVQEQSAFMASRARTRFRELNELKNKVQGQTPAREKIATSAYFLMMQCQQMVDVPTWLGAYEKAIADGNDGERSVSLADQAVIDAQGGGQTKDQSAIERGGPAQKLFTVFYSFMNTAQNLGYASRHTNQGYAKASADAVMLYVVPALLGALLKNALTPGDSGDDKDWKTLSRKLIGEQLTYLLGLFVVGREFGDAAKTAAGLTDHPRDYSGPAGVRAIADTATLAKQISEHKLDEQFRKALINLMGDALALPSAQINRSITGAEALKAGKTHNPAALLLGYQEPHK